MTAELLPAEDMALTVARAQAERGEPVTPNVAVVLVMALDRLTGRSDWTAAGSEAEQADEAPANAVEIADDLFESAHGWRPGGTR